MQKATVPANPFVSPDVPDGYDTVLGYLAKTQKGILRSMDEPVLSTYRDSLWLVSQASMRKIATVYVEAPEASKMLGFDKVMAFPVELLEERLN